MAEDYEVGYGKPPEHSKFKKGQSGNPKGRPKGRKNMKRIVNDILDHSVMIRENGRTRRVKFLEAFVHQLAAKALNGSARDQIALMKAIHDYAPELLKEPSEPEVITVRFVSPDHDKMLESAREAAREVGYEGDLGLFERNDFGSSGTASLHGDAPSHPADGRESGLEGRDESDPQDEVVDDPF